MKSTVWKYWMFLCLTVGVWGFPLGESSQAVAYTFWRNPENGRVRHWNRSRFEKKALSIGLHVTGCPTVSPAELKQTVLSVLSAWSGVECSIVRLIGGEVIENVDAPQTDGISLIKFISKGDDWKWPKGSVMQVIMVTNTQTGEIRDADILLNSWSFQFSTSPQKEFDLQSVLTHGVGRLLGLGYSQNKNAALYDSINPGETDKRVLDQDDKDALCSLYPKDPPCKNGDAVGNTLVCYNGRPEPICAPYTDLCKPCRADTDCRGSGTFCLPGVDGGRCGFDCAATKACPKGYTCRAIKAAGSEKIAGHNCVPDDNTCIGGTLPPCCRDQNDCLPKYQCNQGTCINPSTADPCKGLCKPHEMCEKSKCVLRTCSNDDQCGKGWTCVQGRCTKEGGCTGGCPDGQICSKGRCAGGVGASCKVSSDCAESMACVKGGSLRLCTKRCSAPTECANGEFCVSGLLGEITRGCWPASRSQCKGGRCFPASSGCGCSVTGEHPPIFEGLLLLLCLGWLRWGLRLKRGV